VRILLDYSQDEIKEILTTEFNMPKFRAKQIYEWLTSYLDFEEMTNISKEDRQKLSKSFIARPVIIKEAFKSEDGTIKFLFELITTGDLIEGVLLKYKYGYSLCVSTQVGCRMGCKFCASGLDGLKRHLSTGEIMAEILAVNNYLGGSATERLVTNVVLMGSGEPLDNYDNVIRFIRILNSKEGLDIGQRHITLSTCGLTEKMKELALLKLQITLAVSLHAPNDEIRNTIMPISRKYDFETLLDACRFYTEKTNRRITFEYSLIKGVNDSLSCAEELAARLKGMLCHVNLIPVNDVKERNYVKSGVKFEIDDYIRPQAKVCLPLHKARGDSFLSTKALI